eukprot:6412875-Alexandrium_andersonii.AAC.1
MQIKSPRVATALENVQLLRLHQKLHEFALEQVHHCDNLQQAEHMSKLIVTAGRELFGYLQGMASRHGDFFTSATGLRLRAA